MFLSPSSVCFPKLDPQGNDTLPMLDDILRDKHFSSVKDYPKLQVVQKDRDWYALNSAQLQLFQKWEHEGKCGKVKVDVVPIHHVPTELQNLMVRGGDNKRKQCSGHVSGDEKDRKSRDAILKTKQFSEPQIFSNNWAENNDGRKQAYSVVKEVKNIKPDVVFKHVAEQDTPVSNRTAVQSEVTEYHNGNHEPGGLHFVNSDCEGGGGCEENEECQGHGDSLYKTLSSFELDKQSEIGSTEGVQTARGYQKVQQADPNDTGTDSDSQYSESEQGDDQSDCYSDDHTEYATDSAGDDDPDYADDLDVEGGRYSEGSGGQYSDSELGWSDNEEDGGSVSDGFTDSSASESSAERAPNEQETLL